MAKFKPGPAKTRSGDDVVIFEVSDKIYGKYENSSQSWTIGGRFFEDDRRKDESSLDLIANTEPFYFEAKVLWEKVCGNFVPITQGPFRSFIQLEGKRGTLTFVEDIE